jgi:hypothetical protein
MLARAGPGATFSAPTRCRIASSGQVGFPSRATCAGPRKKESPTERHCESFTPHGARLVIPDGIRELDVRTPGSAGLGLEWTGGTVTVEMKRFSGLLKLHFPALEVGEPAHYQVRYTLLLAE